MIDFFNDAFAQLQWINHFHRTEDCLKKTRHLDKFQQAMERCISCGFCLDACPVFSATNRESFSPRGKLASLRACQLGLVEQKDIETGLYACRQCGLCEKACPARLPLRGIFQAAARDLHRKKNLQQKLLYNLLGHPKVFNFLQPPLAIMRKFAARRKKHKNKIPGQLAFRPFKCGKSSASGGKRSSVLLFTGCLSSRVYPELARACQTILEKHGYLPLTPSLPCCGRLAETSGHDKDAEILAKRALAAISRHEFDFLTSPCPECLRQIGKVWPGYELPEDLKKYASRLAAITVDFARLLSESEACGASGENARQTIFWHKPCLMDGGPAAMIRQLLAARGSVLLRDLPERCCGGRNGYSLLPLFPASHRPYGDLAGGEQLPGNIAQVLRDEIMAAGAEIVATGCPACKLEMEKAMARNDDKVIVRHWLEIYARNLE